MPEAYIYDHVRTPRGRGKPDGSLHEVTALRLAETAMMHRCSVQATGHFMDEDDPTCVEPVIDIRTDKDKAGTFRKRTEAIRDTQDPPKFPGEAGWIPFGDLDLGLGPENATCYPHPGEIVLYPGGVSETEILLAYGYVNFASKAGQLAGNHFATIVEGNEHLRDLGKKFLWEGAQEIEITERREA